MPSRPSDGAKMQSDTSVGQTPIPLSARLYNPRFHRTKAQVVRKDSENTFRLCRRNLTVLEFSHVRDRPPQFIAQLGTEFAHTQNGATRSAPKFRPIGGESGGGDGIRTHDTAY